MEITISTIADIATAITLFGMIFQIAEARREAKTDFEDGLAKEYRELASKIATKAFFGEALSDKEYADHLDEMYRYFDLCNHQAFLAKSKRVSPETWEIWKDGITSNMKRPAFEKAWSEIAARSGGDFSELRAIVPPHHKKQNDAA